MKIIVNGALGRMGGEVCRMVNDGARGATLAAKVDKFGTGEVFASVLNVTAEADVIIDFSHHSAVNELSSYAVEKGIPVVLATTGHTEEELAVIDEMAKKIPVFFSANMSLGVALLAQLAKQTVALFPDADVEIIEKHHNRKLDAPSGTALMLAKAIESVRRGAKFIYGRGGQQKREKDEIGIHAIRGGNIVGEHEILVITDSQIITLKHEAQSRSLFAEGALAAAEFIVGKSAGLYSMYDIAKGN